MIPHLEFQKSVGAILSASLVEHSLLQVLPEMLRVLERNLPSDFGRIETAGKALATVARTSTRPLNALIMYQS